MLELAAAVACNAMFVASTYILIAETRVVDEGEGPPRLEVPQLVLIVVIEATKLAVAMAMVARNGGSVSQ